MDLYNLTYQFFELSGGIFSYIDFTKPRFWILQGNIRIKLHINIHSPKEKGGRKHERDKKGIHKSWEKMEDRR